MQHDYVVRMECGFRGQAIRRRVSTGHGLEPEQYRARWKLSADHPITAPAYSDGRQTAASRRVDAGFGSARTPAKRRVASRDGTLEVPPEMLTPTQQRAVDRFAKSLSTLGDDAFDRYRIIRLGRITETPVPGGSDNLGKAGAESLAAKTAMQKRFADYQSRYKARYP